MELPGRCPSADGPRQGLRPLAATARQLWIQDLSKVYEAIRSSPTGLILERAGEVGYRHEPAFREALSRAQALPPPPPCEAVHEALVGWLTSLHAACLSLILITLSVGALWAYRSLLRRALKWIS